MSIPEFLDALEAKVKAEKATAKLVFFNGHEASAIRVIPQAFDGPFYCPIEYLADKTCAFAHAGPSLGLSDNDIPRIADASDGSLYRSPISEMKEIRRRLLAIFNLQEEAVE